MILISNEKEQLSIYFVNRPTQGSFILVLVILLGFMIVWFKHKDGDKMLQMFAISSEYH